MSEVKELMELSDDEIRDQVRDLDDGEVKKFAQLVVWLQDLASYETSARE